MTTFREKIQQFVKMLPMLFLVETKQLEVAVFTDVDKKVEQILDATSVNNNNAAALVISSNLTKNYHQIHT